MELVYPSLLKKTYILNCTMYFVLPFVEKKKEYNMMFNRIENSIQ
jgi:hypothetical protein